MSLISKKEKVAILKRRSLRLFLIIFLILIIRFYILMPFRIVGVSMEPSILNQQIVVAEKITYNFRTPLRGEMIIFRTKDRPYVYFLKRVVGLPGEKVEIKDGSLLIDNKRVTENYIQKNNLNISPLKIRDDCVFVVGDNRIIPEDDLFFTQVATKNIVGRVIWKK